MIKPEVIVLLHMHPQFQPLSLAYPLQDSVLSFTWSGLMEQRSICICVILFCTNNDQARGDCLVVHAPTIPTSLIGVSLAGFSSLIHLIWPNGAKIHLHLCDTLKILGWCGSALSHNKKTAVHILVDLHSLWFYETVQMIIQPEVLLW
jgi:hypothetical protein